MVYFNVASSSESLENYVMHFIWYISMLAGSSESLRGLCNSLQIVNFNVAGFLERFTNKILRAESVT